MNVIIIECIYTHFLCSYDYMNTGHCTNNEHYLIHYNYLFVFCDTIYFVLDIIYMYIFGVNFDILKLRSEEIILLCIYTCASTLSFIILLCFLCWLPTAYGIKSQNRNMHFNTIGLRIKTVTSQILFCTFQGLWFFNYRINLTIHRVYCVSKLHCFHKINFGYLFSSENAMLLN